MSKSTETPNFRSKLSGRNAKGEWRPPYPAKYAPLFQLPFKLGVALKWLFANPGYFFPWNTIFLLVSMVLWFYFQPPLSRCVELKADWIGLLFFRNLVILWLWYGLWHLLLYTFKLQGTEGKYDARWLSKNDPKFTFRNQLYDNILWSCASGGTCWTVYEVLYMWSAANNWVPYVSWTTHPIYCTLLMCVLPLWREFHFYWVHRFIHIKQLYKHVHALHHRNVNPGPWSGLAMHPVEHIFYFSCTLIHWIVPSHPLHFIYTLQHAVLAPINGHIGFEGPVIKGAIPMGSYFHYLHHRYFECNYGESVLPLDKYFGTFRDGYPQGEGAKLPEEHAN